MKDDHQQSLPAPPDDEQEESGQASFFSADDFGEEPKLVDQTKQFIVSGKVLQKDMERCQGIVEDLLQGLSQRKVARKWAVGRNSLRRIVQLLEEAGMLEPLQQRLSRKLGHVAELSADNLTEALEDGVVPVNVLPVSMGVALDKKERVDAGLGGGSDRRDQALTLEAFEAELRAALPGPGDGQSSGSAGKEADSQ